MVIESRFQSKLISELRDLFPGCIILKNDPNYLQGFPDLLILFNDRWAALEGKKSRNAERQPNQEYYIDLANQMSYASFIYPENKEQILDELQQALRPRRGTRIPLRK
jgi:hypothetical protein